MGRKLRLFTSCLEIGFSEELWVDIGFLQGNMMLLLHELEGRSEDVC